ncbi:hypothetical protein AL705_04700 [Lawsonella clevelandensis]|uniref:Uncharacterized protein n=1 Tax=Lawsonella clevelandensis TaxID=1528099 RepID=A0A0M3TBQ6_9ACTN|nr:hypothetical protein AL705_04700 [Lawsonella clevelandensis]
MFFSMNVGEAAVIYSSTLKLCTLLYQLLSRRILVKSMAVSCGVWTITRLSTNMFSILLDRRNLRLNILLNRPDGIRDQDKSLTMTGLFMPFRMGSSGILN